MNFYQMYSWIKSIFRPRTWVLMVFVVISLVLTACGGQSAAAANSWAGASIDGNQLFVSYGSGVWAVNLDDGKQIWRYPVEPDKNKSFYAPPAIVDGLLVVGDFHNSIYGLDSGNGKEKWSVAGTNGKGRFIAGSLIQDQRIYAPSADYKITAYDQDGKYQWEFLTEGALWARPVSDGERIYQASMDHFLYAIDPQDSSLVWKRDLGGAAVATPLLDNGVLYIGQVGHKFTAVSTSDGEIIWEFEPQSEVWATPVLAEGKLIFGDLKGTIYALDPQSGQTEWTFQADGAIIGSGGVFADGVAFPVEEGGVLALSLDGKQIWRTPVNGKLYSNILVTDELLIAPVTKGDILISALNFNGTERWSFTPDKW